jgi:hypothetical protein
MMMVMIEGDSDKASTTMKNTKEASQSAFSAQYQEPSRSCSLAIFAM